MASNSTPPSDPQQTLIKASNVAGKGLKLAGSYLLPGAGKVAAKVAPDRTWQIMGGVLVAVVAGFVATGGLILFMVMGGTSSSSPTSTASSSTAGGNYSAGPLSCDSIPADYFAWAKSAESAYQTPWALTLAIARNETNFGTYEPPLSIGANGLASLNLSASGIITTNPQDEISSTGAVGTTQFLPSTWSGSNAPGISEFGTGVPYSSVLSALRFQTNPATIQQYGGFGDAYWLAVGKPSGMIANPFNPEQALYATAAYLESNYRATGSWASAVSQYAGGSAGYVSLAMSNEAQIANCE